MTEFQPVDFARTKHYLRLRYNTTQFAATGQTRDQIFAGQFLMTPVAPPTAPLRMVLPAFQNAKYIKIRRIFTAIGQILSTAGPAFIIMRPKIILVEASTAASPASSPILYDGQGQNDAFPLENPPEQYIDKAQLQFIDYTSFTLTVAWDAVDFSTTAVFSMTVGAVHNMIMGVQTLIEIGFTDLPNGGC